jgi:hypothetical protein
MHTLDIDMSFIRLLSGAVKDGHVLEKNFTVGVGPLDRVLLWCQRWMKTDSIVGKQWFRSGVEAIDRHMFDRLGRLRINPAWSHVEPAAVSGNEGSGMEETSRRKNIPDHLFYTLNVLMYCLPRSTRVRSADNGQRQSGATSGHQRTFGDGGIAATRSFGWLASTTLRSKKII